MATQNVKLPEYHPLLKIKSDNINATYVSQWQFGKNEGINSFGFDFPFEKSSRCCVASHWSSIIMQ
jgi:hypothetical protein